MNEKTKNKKRSFENILSNRFFLSKSFETYRGPSGLYEFGPNGSILKNNIKNLWREILIKRENINSIDFYEIDSPVLVPFSVLKNSGHVDKFDDTLIYDLKTGDAYRADHFLETQNIPEELKKDIEFLPCEAINEILKKYEIKSKENNEMGNACKFNLMFSSKIGAKENIKENTNNKIFLRPETAQNQFIYLPKLLKKYQLPFATFSIGKAFRNEISPKNQLLRLREFDQAEIEYFCKDGDDIFDFPLIDDSLDLIFYENTTERNKKISLKESFEKKIIKNKAILYFLSQSVKFLKKLNIKNYRLRQHRPDEMAHYAKDCWDIEIFSEFTDSFVECIGIADRGCFDLKSHSKVDNFVVRENYEEENFKKRYEIKPKFDKKEIYAFGKKINKLKEFLSFINEKVEEEVKKIEKQCFEKFEFKKKGKIEKELIFNFEENDFKMKILFEIEEKMVTSEEFIPRVIEPSFGLSRIMQIFLEQNYQQRGINEKPCLHQKIDIKREEKEEEEKYYFSFPEKMAPTKVCISFLKHSFYKNEKYLKILQKVYENLKIYDPLIIKRNVNIGRKYIQADEQGIRLFVTIDDESEKTGEVTVRCRDCMGQIYSKIDDLKKNIDEFL